MGRGFGRGEERGDALSYVLRISYPRIKVQRGSTHIKLNELDVFHCAISGVEPPCVVCWPKLRDKLAAGKIITTCFYATAWVYVVIPRFAL